MPSDRSRVPSFALAAALAASLCLASCAASMTLSVGSDGSGTLSVDARVPDAVAARLQAYRSAAGGSCSESAPLFDARAIREGTSARGLAALSVETPAPNRFRGSFTIRSLAEAAGNPGLSGSGMLRLESSAKGSTLSFRLSRENAASLPELFPGLDPYILEALSPPALDPYPVTAGEYREMLGALLGEAAARELEGAEAVVRIRLPGAVTGSSGGEASGAAFTASIRIFDLLVLEKPIAFSVSWK